MEQFDRVNVWFDKAWYHLDVVWSPGRCFTPTENDDVWVLVDKDGNITGFKVWGLNKLKGGAIVNQDLTPAELPQVRPAAVEV